MEERWVLVNASGVPVGKTVVRDRDAPELPMGCYHLVAVVWVYAGGKFLLQRRGFGKTYGPGCWSIPGGAVVEGETREEGAARELAEETGIAVRPGQLTHLNSQLSDDYICDAWLLEDDSLLGLPLAYSHGEVECLAWVSRSEVSRLVAEDYLRKHAASYALACKVVDVHEF